MRFKEFKSYIDNKKLIDTLKSYKKKLSPLFTDESDIYILENGSNGCKFVINCCRSMVFVRPIKDGQDFHVIVLKDEWINSIEYTFGVLRIGYSTNDSLEIREDGAGAANIEFVGKDIEENLLIKLMD